MHVPLPAYSCTSTPCTTCHPQQCMAMGRTSYEGMCDLFALRWRGTAGGTSPSSTQPKLPRTSWQKCWQEPSLTPTATRQLTSFTLCSRRSQTSGGSRKCPHVAVGEQLRGLHVFQAVPSDWCWEQESRWDNASCPVLQVEIVIYVARLQIPPVLPLQWVFPAAAQRGGWEPAGAAGHAGLPPGHP